MSYFSHYTLNSLYNSQDSQGTSKVQKGTNNTNYLIVNEDNDTNESINSKQRECNHLDDISNNFDD